MLASADILSSSGGHEARTRARRSRFTHYIHPYPGKLTPSIPGLVLDQIGLPFAGTVFDPFCGSGTVGVEARSRGYNVVMRDVNPFAVLLSRVKCTPVVTDNVLRSLDSAINAPSSRSTGWLDLEYWYSPAAARSLHGIQASVLQIPDRATRELLLVCLSATARRFSRADPLVPVPVRPNLTRLPEGSAKRDRILRHLRFAESGDVRVVFEDIVHRALQSLASLPLTISSVDVDVGDMTTDESPPCDAIVTSPPYPGAQKYVRATSHALYWTGLVSDIVQKRGIDARTVGRDQHISASKNAPPQTGIPVADAAITRIAENSPFCAWKAWHFVTELEAVTTNILAHRPTYVAWISGSNTVSGVTFDTPELLRCITAARGYATIFDVESSIHARAFTTVRSGGSAPIARESITIMHRGRP